MSLRRRIVLLPAIAVAAAVALASVVTWVSVRAQLRDSVDDQLRALSRDVLTAPQRNGQPRRTPQTLLDRPAERRKFLLLLPSSPLGEQDGSAAVHLPALAVTPGSRERACGDRCDGECQAGAVHEAAS